MRGGAHARTRAPTPAPRAPSVVEAARVDPRGPDAHDDPLLVRVVPRVAVLPEVLLRQLVDVLLGVLLLERRAAVDRDPLILVRRVEDEHGHARVVAKVALLRAADGGVE